MMKIDVFTDGSSNLKYATYAFVIVVDNEIVAEEKGEITSDVKKTNVTGELVAAMKGIVAAAKYAFTKKKKPEITVHHDYVGVGKWVTGEWRAKEEHTQAYRTWVTTQQNKVKIDFVHTPDGSHPMNVRAHDLAYAELQRIVRNAK